MRTAIFPGSFDPFTLGHMDVLESSLKLFDNIIIAVGFNSAKEKGYFKPELRVEMIKDIIRDKKNISVCSYSELTVELCKKLNVNYIVRGLRTTTDFELESVIAQANKKMKKDILTVFIPACQEYSFISSTVVRDVLIHNGDASMFLPENIDIEKYIEMNRK
ncbi:MAG: pantetheine-phosphate adenylyltransferase [Bacteroidales bacterium]|jgi:pantetheine-phosphate adenylyltransferase|nr:pantetheine-phosphate adenylyltransferase [Bacteroidales bacterium]